MSRFKQRRCCKLNENSRLICDSRVTNCIRYLCVGEYEFAGTVDMTAKSKSITCFGLGNCEAVPLEVVPDITYGTGAPTQQTMKDAAPRSVNMNGIEKVSIGATQKINLRTLCCVKKWFV